MNVEVPDLTVRQAALELYRSLGMTVQFYKLETCFSNKKTERSGEALSLFYPWDCQSAG